MRKCFVTGCGRSGTTFMTSVLRKLGYDLGGVTRLSERIRVQLINDRLLQAEGFRWYTADRSIGDASLTNREIEIIGEVDAVKDPRLSFLYPSYKNAFPDYLVIICERDKEMCARSIAKFTSTTVQHGREVWENHTRAIKEWCDETEVVWVKFPSLEGIEKVGRILGYNNIMKVANQVFNLKLVHFNREEDVRQC